jgi:hypothetical protein
MQKRTGLALLLMMTVALAVGCSSAKTASVSNGSAKEMTAPAGAVAYDANRGGVATMTSAAQAKPAPPQTPVPAPGGNSVPETAVAQRKEIKNASFDLKVKNVDEADQKLRAAVQAAGGFVQTSQVDGQKENGRHMTIQLRIPVAGYASTFSAISSLGEEITRKEWTEDVTQEYYDLEARIKVQEAHAEQLKSLYAKTGTIPEMIQLEQEIARVQAELDSLKGRYQYLSNQVAFSTITVSMYEPGAPAPIKPATSVWERLTQGFTGSWHGMVNFSGDLLVFLVSAIPVVVPLGIVGWGGFRIVQSIKRRRGNGGPGSSAGGAPAGSSGGNSGVSSGPGSELP